MSTCVKTVTMLMFNEEKTRGRLTWTLPATWCLECNVGDPCHVINCCYSILPNSE